jgi:hypothetical protein
MASKIKVSERAVLARVNRKLSHDNEALRKYRGNNKPAEYFHLDITHNSILSECVELEDFARDCKVLAPYEVIVM